MATLSNLNGNHFHAFGISDHHFLVAFAEHPNPAWTSTLTEAPGMLPDPVTGGTAPVPLYHFYSEPPDPGTIVIQVIRPVAITLRIERPSGAHVYVQDGHGLHQVTVVNVT